MIELQLNQLLEFIGYFMVYLTGKQKLVLKLTEEKFYLKIGLKSLTK